MDKRKNCPKCGNKLIEVKKGTWVCLCAKQNTSRNRANWRDYMNIEGMTEIVFMSVEQRDMQLEAFKSGSYLIDKKNPLVVYIKLI